ncbi:MAG: hypothetical protein K2I72_00930 [Bacilli bacterium]|nr:hypothetical protein [Bacilli bacterium]
MNENPNVNENKNQTPTPEAVTPTVTPNGDNNQAQAPVASTPIANPAPVVTEPQPTAQPVAPVNPTTATVEPVPTTASATPTPQPAAPEVETGEQNYVSGSSNVNPVLKETSKVSFGEKPLEAEVKVETETHSPMEEKKETKKTRSVIPLIIFFIFLFAFVFLLPNITDYFKEQEGKKKIEEFDQALREEEERQKKEEEEARKEEQQQHQEEQQYKTMTCVSEPATEVNTTTITTREFTYLGDKLKDVKISTDIQYLALDESYEAKKTVCENKTMASSTLIGYDFGCSISELEIEESSSYDLKEFKTQTLTNSDGSEETIETEYKYDSSISTIEQTLTNQGYTCQK